MLRVTHLVAAIVGPAVDPIERRKATIAASVCLFALVSAPLFLVADLLLQNPIGVAVNLALSVVFALCLWGIRSGRRTAAEWALISSLSVLGNFAAWTGGGVASGAFSVNAVVLVFAAVLLRGPGLVLAFLGALVGALATPWSPHWLTMPLSFDIFFWVTILGLLSIAAYALVRESEAALADARQKAAELQSTVVELERSRVSRNYIQGLLSGLSELILVADHDHIVEFVEGQLPAWVGWEPEELIGMPIVRIFDGVDLEHPEHAREVQLLRGDGGRVAVMVTKGPIESGFVWAATDVTALASTTMALRQAHDRARAANAAKSNFLAKMSHELRTPLNAILGYSELLQDEVEDESQLQDLGRIGRAALSLLDLINGVLDLSKIEAGQAELHQEHLSLREVVEPVVTGLEPLLRSKRLTFEVGGDGLDGLPIYSDRLKLRQILQSLLSNAVKFTDEGGVQLLVERWERSRLPWLRLVVVDSGIGMHAADLNVAFEPFTQADDGPDGRSGTGLGLSICKAYVEMLGGQITAESELGKGSRFVVELPVARYSELTPKTPAFPMPEGVDTLQRVVVIDDDPEFLEFASRILTAEGRQVVCTSDPIQALGWADRFVADLIVVDISMPILNGWTFVVRLRETRSASSPVLVVSGDADREVADALGCAALMLKPVAPKELLGMVDSLALRGTPAS